MNAQGWQTWLERLYILRRDKRGSHERPHNPVWLLSVIDLLDRDLIARNEITLSDDLVRVFRRHFAGFARRTTSPRSRIRSTSSP